MVGWVQVNICSLPVLLVSAVKHAPAKRHPIPGSLRKALSQIGGVWRYGHDKGVTVPINDYEGVHEGCFETA